MKFGPQNRIMVPETLGVSDRRVVTLDIAIDLFARSRGDNSLFLRAKKLLELNRIR